MANDLQIPREFQIAIKPLFSKFKKRYSAAKLGITDLEHAHAWFGLAELYYAECSDEGITAEDVSAYGEQAISASSYATFPPTARGFACDVRKLKEDQLIGARIPECFVQLFEWLDSRYPGRWCIGTSKMKVLQDWVAFLADYKRDAFDYEKAVSIVRNAVDFQRYPPNFAQVEKVLLMSSSNENIPHSSEAYHLATCSKDSSEIPAIIRYARHKFGSYSLRIRSDAMVRRDFADFYERIVDEYLKGEIDILGDYRDTGIEGKGDREPVMEKKKAVDLISGM